MSHLVFGIGDVRGPLLALPHHPEPDMAGHYLVSDIFPVKAALLEELHDELRRGAHPAGPDRGVTSVLEFGAYFGYFLATALLVCPEIERVAWSDDESAMMGSNLLCAENIDAVNPVPRRRMARTSAELMWEVRGEQFDVVHVDGDHSYDACLTDLSWALSLRPRMILVDDYGSRTCPGVTRAVLTFAAFTGLTFDVVSTVNGLAVFRP